MKGINMKLTNCKDCEGKGYYTDVTSSGLSDPNDPYHEPHIERCDSCKIFNDDVEAKEYHEKHTWSIGYIYWVGMEGR